MEDTYIKMLIAERKKLGISVRELCEGICSEDLYYLLEKGKCNGDRITIKRFLARLGIDNADYEHYLEYPDYEMWKRRMKIVNFIEDDRLEEAEELLSQYPIYEEKVRNISREGIESQFLIFMKLQIMRRRNAKEYEKKALRLYEQAVKLTVPAVDAKTLKELVLSPLEYILVLEYNSKAYKYRDIYEVLERYNVFYEYIKNSNYSRLSVAKVYPKLVVVMYETVKKFMKKQPVATWEIYQTLLTYNENAMDYLKSRKVFYYMLELLEMRKDLLLAMKAYEISLSKSLEYEEMFKTTMQHIKAFKEVHNEFGVEPYMMDDCYLYRESGIYCIGDVLRKRRKMQGISQNKLCEGICSVRTLMREENLKTTIVKGIFKDIFSRLKLYPDYINMGVVTSKKDVVELYEELRYAVNAFMYEDVTRLLSELKMVLLDKANCHPINYQVIKRIESFSLWRMGKRDTETHIESLIEALEQTLSMDFAMKNGIKKFFTTEELTTLYLISVAYKKVGMKEEARKYIEVMWDYVKDIENQGLEDGRMGIYETIMTHIANFLGSDNQYEESNTISDKLVKISLKLKRNCMVHHNLYNKIWNDSQMYKNSDNYKRQIQKCIYFSQLADDKNYEIFYKGKLTE